MGERKQYIIEMTVIIHPHAQLRLIERGVSVEEITAVIESDERFEAKYDRIGFRKVFTFNAAWLGKHYANKQVEVFTVREGENWVVITVIAKYF